MLLNRHIIYVCSLTMPVVACSVLVVSVLIAGKVVGISVKVNPASVSVRCDHKRMSVRITIDGSCLICVGKLLICESCRVGNCCRAGITGAVIAFGSVAATVCASCCICGCTAVCSCRRSICCCAAVCCICVCIRRSCVCIVGCRSGSCCLLRSCFFQRRITKDLERIYGSFHCGKNIFFVNRCFDAVVFGIVCDNLVDHIQASVALLCVQHLGCVGVHANAIHICRV